MVVGPQERLVVDWIYLAGCGAEAVQFGRELIAGYQQPHRRYHTTEHLRHVLKVVDQLSDEAPDIAAVRYAAWFHDAVYDVGGTEEAAAPVDLSNEERSARLAESVLTALYRPADLVEEVARLVRSTAEHRFAPGDGNAAVLCDADLAILGTDPETYERYSGQIREEYRRYPDPLYQAGRSAVLRGFLERRAIFHTRTGRDLFEDAARRNIAAELARLAVE